MKTSLSRTVLARYLARQLDHFFPDEAAGVEDEIARFLPSALNRLATLVAGVQPPLFHRDGVPQFNHLHGDQYAIFLYLIANEIGTAGGSAEVATKCYLLNKALHGLDVFYEVRLPRLFLFSHPVGTVLGRAEYSDGFMVAQQCIVGNVRGDYPKLGRGVALCAGSAVIGAAEVGDEVTFGAGSMLIGGKVPSHTTVVGRAKEVRLLPSKQPLWRNYFRM
jgi:serine O-acetyltransferase